MNGLWQGPYTPNLAVAYGKELPFTAHGADRWAKVDTANDPTGFCLPVGPARGIQAPFPFQIVQTPQMVAILFEYQRTYRMIYTDGRKPPDDIHEYPEWMGFSTGRWEGDTLVVDTIAIDDRTWLDTAGHQHSDKLRLTERFRKSERHDDRMVGHLRRSGVLQGTVDGDAAVHARQADRSRDVLLVRGEQQGHPALEANQTARVRLRHL